jgi:DNA polymerase/3'-5' exonuclease PolX
MGGKNWPNPPIQRETVEAIYEDVVKILPEDLPSTLVGSVLDKNKESFGDVDILVEFAPPLNQTPQGASRGKTPAERRKQGIEQMQALFTAAPWLEGMNYVVNPGIDVLSYAWPLAFDRHVQVDIIPVHNMEWSTWVYHPAGAARNEALRVLAQERGYKFRRNEGFTDSHGALLTVVPAEMLTALRLDPDLADANPRLIADVIWHKLTQKGQNKVFKAWTRLGPQPKTVLQ